jgi:hypothetical protein
MNFNIAGRDFRIGKELQSPVLAGDFIFPYVRFGAKERLYRFSVQPGDVRAKRAAGIVSHQMKDTAEVCVIFGIQINAENTGEQDRIGQLKLAELGIPDQFINDDPATEFLPRDS